MAEHESYTLRLADASEASIIAELVNRAFAVEKFFKSGDRTDSGQIAKMFGDGDFLLLLSGTELVASVHVRLNGERAYVGMLAVEPTQQRAGIGRRMMYEAEEYARAHGCKVLDIRIVNVRPELSAIYEKLGFVPTGTQSAEVITSATRPVEFITMAKPL